MRHSGLCSGPPTEILKWPHRPPRPCWRWLQLQPSCGSPRVYATAETFFVPFLHISDHFKYSFWRKNVWRWDLQLEWHICNICHSSRMYVTPAVRPRQNGRYSAMTFSNDENINTLAPITLKRIIVFAVNNKSSVVSIMASRRIGRSASHYRKQCW